MQEQRRGFTLVEAMVALLILSVGMLALGRLQGSMTQSSAQAKARTEALRLAEGKIEELRGFSSLAAVTGYANSADTVTGTNAVFTRSWSWTNTAAPAYRSVQVTVAWQDRSGSQSVGLRTLLGQVDPAEAGSILYLLAHP
ncbi:MAG: prepilin-type N-terminal cleavage/methylation domain-containing protein [Magnetococcus sp. DMHC-8]